MVKYRSCSLPRNNFRSHGMLRRKPSKSTPILTAQELRRGVQQRASINHETYKQLYRICTTAITRLQPVRPPVTKCSWTVPEHILWRPPYKRDHAVRYVRDKLQHYGFSVTIRDEFTLDIDWSVKKKKKKKTKTLPPLVAPPPPPSQRTRLAEMAARAERMTGRLNT